MRDDKMLLSLLALALAVLGVAMLLRWASEPAEYEPASQSAPPVLRITVGGVTRCACVPVPSGCYTAKHCLADVPARADVRVNGVRVYGWTLDPDRDLAHVGAGANPTQEIGAPYEGALGEWRGLRGGRALFRFAGHVIGPVYRDGKLEVQRQSFDAWCYARSGIRGGLPAFGDDLIAPGDSGGGFFVDGKLVGILSLYDTEGCGAWTVRVP